MQMARACFFLGELCWASLFEILPLKMLFLKIVYNLVIFHKNFVMQWLCSVLRSRKTQISIALEARFISVI